MIMYFSINFSGFIWCMVELFELDQLVKKEVKSKYLLKLFNFLLNLQLNCG